MKNALNVRTLEIVTTAEFVKIIFVLVVSQIATVKMAKSAVTSPCVSTVRQIPTVRVRDTVSGVNASTVCQTTTVTTTGTRGDVTAGDVSNVETTDIAAHTNNVTNKNIAIKNFLNRSGEPVIL